MTRQQRAKMEEEKNGRGWEIPEGAYGDERKGSGAECKSVVGSVAESGVESRRREGARRGMYFSCCEEERERRGGKTIPVPSYRSLDDDSDYCPTKGNEESDTSTSDSSEDWNDEFVDGRRSKEKLYGPSDRGYQSEYDNSDKDVLTPSYSNDDYGSIRTLRRGRRYEPGCPIEAIKFDVGMKFESATKFTTDVKNYDVCNGLNIRFMSSGARKVEVRCDRECLWRIYPRIDGMKQHFVVKTLNDTHTCNRPPRNRQAGYNWIANHFLEKFRTHMNLRVGDMMNHIKEKFGIIVSKTTCYKARSMARKMLRGTLAEHCHLLPAYVEELKKVSRGSTFEMVLEEDANDSLIRFKRLNICFDSLAQGSLTSCRRVIGLDGCFLKIETKGQLLSVVGRDGNNQMFPIAWAVVEGENRIRGLGLFSC